MKAVELVAPERLRLAEREAPAPGPDEVRIAVSVVGVCGTDLEFYRGRRTADYPFVLGHECSGRVEALGDGATGLTVGAPVTVRPNFGCGSCPDCLEGRENICSNSRGLGVTIDGCLSESIVAPARYVWPIPERMDLETAALIEPAAVGAVDLRRLAVEYEIRANPCWPMPHLRECLESLRHRGLLLGIISNAQFYTRELFDALLDATPEARGFDPDLQFYSYQHGRAKPGTALHELAVEALRQKRIGCHEVLFVGNDMLNDVLPASRVGFRTALFAGDARSLRRRQRDPRTEGISLDLVVTDLRQILAGIIV